MSTQEHVQKSPQTQNHVEIPEFAVQSGFTGDYLRYLRKASNFNKKGARKKLLPDGALRWNKGSEFLIERDGKIVSYGEN